jgi:hypothetical protein
MATRFSAPVVRRGQVPLTQEDVDVLAEVVGSETERGVLADLCLCMVPPTGEIRESVVLHALLEVGIRTFREARDEMGYAQLAQDPEYMKHAANVRNNRALRRRPPYANEA